MAHERMAGRRRFYKVVDVRKVTEGEEGKDSVDSPISMGVDGMDSASGVISRPSVETEGNRQDAACFGERFKGTYRIHNLNRVVKLKTC